MITTKIDIQIRFADVDMLGHVNNVNLQHYFDLGKSDYFRTIMHVGTDWSQQGLIAANTNTSYFIQTRLTDRIYVETSTERIGEKSLTLYQRIISHDDGSVRAESRTVLVAFNFARQESIPVPQEWRTAIGL